MASVHPVSPASGIGAENHGSRSDSWQHEMLNDSKEWREAFGAGNRWMPLIEHVVECVVDLRP